MIITLYGTKITFFIIIIICIIMVSKRPSLKFKPIKSSTYLVQLRHDINYVRY